MNNPNEIVSLSHNTAKYTIGVIAIIQLAKRIINQIKTANVSFIFYRIKCESGNAPSVWFGIK